MIRKLGLGRCHLQIIFYQSELEFDFVKNLLLSTGLELVGPADQQNGPF